MQNVLLIDSYDSFTFNLSTLVEKVTGARVVTVHNDQITSEQLHSLLPHFDAVVVGPGPGSPDIASDVGVLPELWKLTQPVPVFGVCLGFQSMVLGFGGRISRLNTVQHGQPGKIDHSGDDIFQGLGDFESIRYHSLHAAGGLVKPLAWVNDATEKVLMAGRHPQLPYYGVQYHPESICSERGEQVFANFWSKAQEYNRQHRQIKPFDESIAKFDIKPAPFEREFELSKQPIQYKSVANLGDVPSYSQFAVQVCDFVKTLGYDFTLLNSGSEPGRWSIIGLLEPGVTNLLTHYLTYKPDTVFINTYKGHDEAETEHKLSEGGIYEYLANYMVPKLQRFKNSQGPPDATFVGGLVGYLSYELSANGPNSTPQLDKRVYADVSLADIDKTILIDQHTSTMYVVSLNDTEFLTSMNTSLKEFVATQRGDAAAAAEAAPNSCQAYFTEKTQFKFPDQQAYIEKIEKCKEYLLSGDSYELCLTAQTEINLPEYLDPWKLYKILLKRNPSPYSCFLDLFDSTLVGSSPERFMSWDRNGTCEFRPIKGTVKKTPTMTYKTANALLNTNKERGENLMIVDLIRHDLNQIVSNVRVDKLMTVEEYHTVYQLVSVIKGELPKNYLGVDLLARSLPPGSMTGAPKIRSVEILKQLEDHPRRGIYSGVCGFWSVTDEADWSVVIRSAFNYKQEDDKLWRIGAGGAITILSEAQAEWEEMQTKLESALQAFV